MKDYVKKISKDEFIIETCRGREKWYCIDKCKDVTRTFYLLENCDYGEEVPFIIIDNEGTVWEWNWYDDLDVFIEELRYKYFTITE